MKATTFSRAAKWITSVLAVTTIAFSPPKLSLAKNRSTEPADNQRKLTSFLLPPDFLTLPAFGFSGKFRDKNGLIEDDRFDLRIRIAPMPDSFGLGVFFGIDAQASNRESGQTSKQKRAAYKGGIVIEAKPIDWLLLRTLVGANSFSKRYDGYLGEDPVFAKDKGTRFYLQGELETSWRNFSFGAFGSTDLKEGAGALAYFHFNNWAGVIEILASARWHTTEAVYLDPRPGTAILNTWEVNAETRVPLFSVFGLDAGYLFSTLPQVYGKTQHGWQVGAAILSEHAHVIIGYRSDPTTEKFAFLALEFSVWDPGGTFCGRFRKFWQSETLLELRGTQNRF